MPDKTMVGAVVVGTPFKVGDHLLGLEVIIEPLAWVCETSDE
jgi:hypothetical protein